MNQNIFEYATRHKLRFGSVRGDLTTEQLWDLPLRSKDNFDLDAVAKATNAKLKALTEESFVSTEKTPASTKVEVALEVVKTIIASKLADEAAAKKKAANKVEKKRLLGILAEKQTGALSALTEAELQKRIADLGE